ncbi:MAG TPA: 30S ribosome-binding factor RbfA [Gemmatimonadetes bacterium]|nr:30S ribosome-binding factor RbfA [Gemmatimonadota bacterium]|tara:strand:- start:349 stop:711 length:363 start_codon:yes stop_codon:yes gene_type:complete
MANRRVERLNEQLRREISDILRRDVRDPRVGVPTVTRVEVTPDLWMARVFVRVVGSGLDRQEALVGLDAAAPFVRRELGGLRMRRVPEIRFEVDETLEHASRIEELLRDVMSGEGDGEDV